MYGIEPVKTKREWLREQSQEQLITFIMNGDMMQDILRDKLFILTGCHDFGSSDGMNGSCVECCYENRALFDRCCLFGDAYRKYESLKIERETTTNEST